MVALKKVELKQVTLDVSITPEQITRSMGYTKAAPPNLEERIESTVNGALPLLKPVGVYTTLGIKSVGKTVVADNTIINSRDVAALIKPCSKLSLFLVTIGPLLEQRVQESDSLDALIIDTLGSVAVEEAANKLNQQIAKEAQGKGFKTTTRYSIGYGDWDIGQQKELLDLLEGGRIGITLTESFIMIPQKSITAVLGWYKE